MDLVERLRVKNKLEQLGQTQPVLSTDLREEFSTSTSTSNSTLTLNTAFVNPGGFGKGNSSRVDICAFFSGSVIFLPQKLRSLDFF